MKKQLSRIIFILIISLFIHPLISHLQAELTEEMIKIRREPLKGIKGVYVYIESLPPEAKELGITKELLKTEAELKLRLAGIKVYSKKESLKGSTASQDLYVNINIIRLSLGGIIIYPFRIGISIDDDVYIERNSMRTTAEIWEYGTLGAITKKNALKHIRESMKRLLDVFLNDYLAVNPKK